MRDHRSIVRLLVVFVLVASTMPGMLRGRQLPSALGDEDFWRMVNDFSEAGGSFDSDNFVSNETGFQSVLPRLLERVSGGGVYIGVGPEQNFTYIAALQPKMAFIVDIRRQNMLQHLMYKALFELSSDRADFLSRLFSRARPAGLDATASVQDLFSAYELISVDERLFQQNLQAVIDRLVNTHKFSLMDSDRNTIASVMTAFFAKGPRITYVNPASPDFAGQATLTQLMTAVDALGKTQSFLASDKTFTIVRDLHRRNLVVPVVGDFAGDRALQRIGDYLRQHEATVTVFYTSNVERYLYGSPRRPLEDWKRFYANVAKLPLADSSTFIRAGASVQQSVIGSMGLIVETFSRGGLKAFADVLATSK